MQHIIHHLRSRPDHHKRAIVLSLSFGITAIIFLVWLSFVRVELARLDDPDAIVETKSPLSFIKENVANVYSGIQNDLGKIKN